MSPWLQAQMDLQRMAWPLSVSAACLNQRPLARPNQRSEPRQELCRWPQLAVQRLPWALPLPSVPASPQQACLQPFALHPCRCQTLQPEWTCSQQLAPHQRVGQQQPGPLLPLPEQPREWLLLSQTCLQQVLLLREAWSRRELLVPQEVCPPEVLALPAARTSSGWQVWHPTVPAGLVHLRLQPQHSLSPPRRQLLGPIHRLLGQEVAW